MEVICTTYVSLKQIQMQINPFLAPCWRSGFTEDQILSEFKPAFPTVAITTEADREIWGTWHRHDSNYFFCFKNTYWNRYKSFSRTPYLQLWSNFQREMESERVHKGEEWPSHCRTRIVFHSIKSFSAWGRKKKSRPVAFHVARRCGSLFVVARWCAYRSQSKSPAWAVERDAKPNCYDMLIFYLRA